MTFAATVRERTWVQSMRFKKDGKVYNLAEAIFEYCKTTECSFCDVCDAVKYTCGNEAKDLAALMGFEIIEDDTPTIAEVVEKYGEDVKPDPVNRPAHYTSGGIECIDAMQAAFGDDAVKDFCLCNAFKYLWRHRQKNGVEDLKKCRWYLNRLIREMEVKE